MKKVNTLFLSTVLLLATVGMQSCNKSGIKRTATTEDGMEYAYIEEGDSRPNEGDYVLYHVIAKTSNDSIFINTYDFGMPQYFISSDSIPFQRGIDEIVLGLKKGDSIQINATVEKIFGEFGAPPFLKSDESVALNIGVVDVIPENEFQDYFTAMSDQMRLKQERDAEKQLTDDIASLENYISENNLNATKTESGLFYVIEEEGEGEPVDAGDMVSVHYTGYVLDGTLFDTSVAETAQEKGVFNAQRDYAPIEVQVGTGMVIRGWDEGLGYLKKGSKAKLLIPSPLAYGPNQRSEVIKPNSILIFDVEVTDVKKQ
ncbi:FKBP-type peptidyl-prolyl cis-trans isomerase [Pararhodonellum marinum]|uniref:FKBP-type peptidyl-prolyl cis-trans isomerase n=1 Tax=Pararhodonellum marinum TaxID=2755358 RepID=UPI00188E5964|nr:FKBP-type peptidyl-prolyl cis-trans isomerase [Pararhodonellum marinum]